MQQAALTDEEGSALFAKELQLAGEYAPHFPRRVVRPKPSRAGPAAENSPGTLFFPRGSEMKRGNSKIFDSKIL